MWSMRCLRDWLMKMAVAGIGGLSVEFRKGIVPIGVEFTGENCCVVVGEQVLYVLIALVIL